MKVNKSFVLPGWKNDLQDWSDLANSATSILLKIYQNSPSFTKYYKIFRSKPSQSEVNDILKSDPNSILPFAFISNADPNFFNQYFDDDLVDSILLSRDTISPRCGKLLHSAILNNLKDYDNKVTDTSRKQIISQLKNTNIIDVDALDRIGLFKSQPISKLVNFCIENSTEPEDVLKKAGIQLPVNSKLLSIVNIKILLVKLKGLDFREDNELSSKIYQKNLYNLEYLNSDLVGHEIIRIILSSNFSVELHRNWTQLILSIASDPRTSTQSRKYQKWWTRISQDLIDRFIKILSHSEILLFLDSIAVFASEENSEMSRMFESRRQLLVGLSIQNKIEKSRLFLPIKVVNFLKNENPKLDLSYVCILNGTQDKCVIYLKIGDFHVIEGSHNCKIRMYPEFYSQNEILNPSLSSIEYGKITTGLETFHYYNHNVKPYALVHHPNGGWKKKIIRVLKDSMDFEVDKLLTDREINYFRF